MKPVKHLNNPQDELPLEIRPLDVHQFMQIAALRSSAVAVPSSSAGITMTAPRQANVIGVVTQLDADESHRATEVESPPAFDLFEPLTLVLRAMTGRVAAASHRGPPQSAQQEKTSRTVKSSRDDPMA